MSSSLLGHMTAYVWRTQNRNLTQLELPRKYENLEWGEYEQILALLISDIITIRLTIREMSNDSRLQVEIRPPDPDFFLIAKIE